MENHKEDILKKLLQDTFSDYEPEPNEASWENIFSAIQPNQPTLWNKSKPWIATILIILTGIWLWYNSTTVEAINTEVAYNNNVPIGTMVSGRVGTLATDENWLMKTRTKKGFENRMQSDDSQTDKPTQLRGNTKIVLQKGNFRKSPNKSLLNESILHKEIIILENSQKNKPYQLENTTISQSIENQTITKYIPQAKNKSSLTKYSKEIIVKINTPNEGGENHPIVEKQLDETKISSNNLIVSTSKRVETIGADNNKSEQVETLAIDRTTSINGREEAFALNKENSIIEKVRYISPLESLRNKDFTLVKIALNSHLIMPVVSPNRETKPVRQHAYLSMSITPIQTYRILTINNHNVQNVQTSNLFDSERNGWAFDLGVMKPIGKLWNFRANLSYLKMRQWSEYQIGTNELILRNNNKSSSNSNPSQGNLTELEVVGQTVSESKNLHMVGLKIDVQKFFKITPKNRYFISTGTQVMYENTQKQSNIFLNVSAGFQHIVSKTTFLTIEPLASYSLNNFNDSKSLLQATGYNLGVKMGVSFKIK